MKKCCILLVAYIVVLVMHGHTNIKFLTLHLTSILKVNGLTPAASYPKSYFHVN